MDRYGNGIGGRLGRFDSEDSHDGTLNGDATWIDGVYGGAFQLDGSDDHMMCDLIDGSGLNEDDEHGVAADDMWLTSAPADEALYIEYAFDAVYKLHEMLVWNYNTQFELVLGASSLGAWNNADTLSREMTGEMDNVLIYDRALSEGEILCLSKLTLVCVKVAILWVDIKAERGEECG